MNKKLREKGCQDYLKGRLITEFRGGERDRAEYEIGWRMAQRSYRKRFPNWNKTGETRLHRAS